MPDSRIEINMNQNAAGANSEYFKGLLENTGCTAYKFSDTPLVLEQNQFNKLNKAVMGMLDVVDTPEYFQHCMGQKQWNLPTIPMLSTDFHGCADFLLTTKGAKLIEMNINIPGKIGLMETLGEMAQGHLELSKGRWTNLNFNEQLKFEIEDALVGAKKIAILVSHFESSTEHMSHYQYFSKELNEEGLNTTVIHANEIVVEEAGVRWKGELYDGVINLVIPFVWEQNQHEFGELTKLLHQRPDRIFPSPTGGMLGTKDLLSYLSSRRDHPSSETWKDNVLFAKSLNEFESTSDLFEVLQPEQLVLKPFKDCGAEGVYVRPSRELVEEIFNSRKSDYMVQEFTDSIWGMIHTESNEQVECHSTIYRVFFASKNPFGYQAYYITGDLAGAYHSAPVQVV